ncbi:ABC transporter substrate-binding protein [Saccharopolyspora hattusasensis]|uniref:ABC transporter substrate-binding protein n=1 Tax=Saccharopolyspora hattusasensis TaxID=1128679 RepID=UPI003D991078
MKKYPLRRRTFVLATAVTISLLAGCATENPTARTPNTAGETVNLVYAYDGLFTAPFGQIASDLQSRTGMSVELQLAGNSYEDSLARLQNDLTAGNPPDITMVGLNQVRMLVDAGAAVPVGKFIDSDDEFDLGQYSQNMLDLTTFDGELYGMPNAVSTLVMYYNADLFTKAGLDPDSPPQTWEDVEKAARAIVDSGAATYGHWSDFESVWSFENFLRSNGGSMMDATEKDITFNDTAGVEVLEYWRRMVESGLMPAFGTDDGREAFFRGDVAMTVDSSAQVANYERTAGFDLRTAMLPIPADGQRQAPGAGNALVITATDPERQQLAWEALKAFVSPAGSTTTTKATGYLPVNAYAAQSNEYLAEFLSSDPTRDAVRKQGASLVRWFSWPGERGPAIAKELQNAIYRAVSGEQRPQDALNQAARAASELLP